jgi:hypothetical protein
MQPVFLGLNVVGLLVLIFLISVGVYDIYLSQTGKKTITQKVHRWFPRWGDAIVLCGIMIGIWAILGPNFFVTVLCGCIIGHLFWGAD